MTIGRPTDLADESRRQRSVLTPLEAERLAAWAHDYRASAAHGMSVNEFRRAAFVGWLWRSKRISEGIEP